MIKNFDEKSNWDAKYIPNFRVIRQIGTRQQEFSNPTGRLRKVNIFDMHKVLPSELMVSCIPDEQVFARKVEYINDPYILKEVMVINTFLHENCMDIGFRH